MLHQISIAGRKSYTRPTSTFLSCVSPFLGSPTGIETPPMHVIKKNNFPTIFHSHILHQNSQYNKESLISSYCLHLLRIKSTQQFTTVFLLSFSIKCNLKLYGYFFTIHNLYNNSIQSQLRPKTIQLFKKIKIEC